MKKDKDGKRILEFPVKGPAPTAPAEVPKESVEKEYKGKKHTWGAMNKGGNDISLISPISQNILFSWVRATGRMPTREEATAAVNAAEFLKDALDVKLEQIMSDEDAVIRAKYNGTGIVPADEDNAAGLMSDAGLRNDQ